MSRIHRLLIVCAVCFMLVAGSPAVLEAVDDLEEVFISVSPTSGHVGDEVTVRGYNFDSDEEVEVYFYRGGGASGRVKVATDETDNDGDFKVEFTVPETFTGEHKIRAETDYEDADEYFTVEPYLEIDPDEGPVGTTVDVNGTGFDEDEEEIELRYYLDGSDYDVVEDGLQADEWGSWEISFKIPMSSSGDHKLRARGETTDLGDLDDIYFEVRPGIAIDLTQGHVGDSITINGSGFDEGENEIEVSFDNQVVVQDIKADSNGAWEETIQVPEMPGGSYDVTAEGDRTDKSDIKDLSFRVEPNLLLVPSTGHVGSELTLTGTGFAATKELILLYDDSQVETTATNDKGSFSNLKFSVPKSVHGAHTLTAEDSTGNAVSAPFTMESQPPPMPALESPGNGGRVGLAGKAAPTFQWSAVTDDSGVSYSLQVSDTEDFAVLEISVTNLNEPGYVVPKEQALAYGTYYWRVKAVDGAQNDSGWTAAYSFHSGLLPLWGFIAIIALLVVLAGILIYFVVVRRREFYD